MKSKIAYINLSDSTINESIVEEELAPIPLGLSLLKDDEIAIVTLPELFSNSGYLIFFYSEYDNKPTYVRACTNCFSPIISHNYQAIVIKGFARKLSYIRFDEHFELSTCENLRSRSFKDTFEILKHDDESILAIAEAGERCVYSAALFSSDNEASLGNSIGAIFGKKNLKAIVIKGKKSSIAIDKDIKKRLNSSKLVKRLKRDGEGSFLFESFKYSWLNSKNFSQTNDPRALHLLGENYSRMFVSSQVACSYCLIGCRRKLKKLSPSPDFRVNIALGSALGFYSPDKILLFQDKALEVGLDPVECGLLLSSLKSEKNLSFEYPQLESADVDEIIRVIRLIGQKKGIGEPVSKGFSSAITLDNRPILIDYRGANIQAIFDIYGETGVAYPDLIYGLSQRFDPYTLGCLAAYLHVLSHAFINIGLPHLHEMPLIYERLFRYKSIKLILFFLKRSKIFNYTSKEIFALGLSSLKSYKEKRGDVCQIPAIFTDSVKDDGSTLKLSTLLSAYESALCEIENYILSK